MTDLEISKALALAIGHKPEDIFEYKKCIQVSDHEEVEDRDFDYRDWNVIGPIAAKYNAFPNQCKHLNNQWLSCAVVDDEYGEAVADSPQKAIALAVIQGAKR